MKGYKALDEDMRAADENGMQLEIGKIYSVEGELIPYQNGFHFCDRIERLNIYYSIVKNRIFEVEADSEVDICDEMMYVARKIKLIRELSKEEILNYFKENREKFCNCKQAEIREAVAEQGLCLDILIHDENFNVRGAVAKQRYGLDILIHDKDEGVRCTVAGQGYGLNELIYDKNWFVRCAVAEQGYGLDILIRDRDECVRIAVAEQGYGLDKLIYDKAWCVRRAVAEQGYGLDKLINDKDWGVRLAVAKEGYGLDKLVHDEKLAVRNMARKMLDKKGGCQ